MFKDNFRQWLAPVVKFGQLQATDGKFGLPALCNYLQFYATVRNFGQLLAIFDNFGQLLAAIVNCVQLLVTYGIFGIMLPR